MSDVVKLQQQQFATRVIFFLFGFTMSAWAPLIPITKIRMGLDDGQLGLLLLCLGTGSLIAMPLAGAASGRIGVRPVVGIASTALIISFPSLLFVSSPLVLGAALTVFGAAIGAIDCVINVQAIEVEKKSRQKMMSGFHGLFSVGGICGPAIVSAMLISGLTTTWVAGVVSLAIFLLTIIAWPGILAAGVYRTGAFFAVPRGTVLILSLALQLHFGFQMRSPRGRLMGASPA